VWIKIQQYKENLAIIEQVASTQLINSVEIIPLNIGRFLARQSRQFRLNLCLAIWVCGWKEGCLAYAIWLDLKGAAAPPRIPGFPGPSSAFESTPVRKTAG
jgi:hypothetical protein